MTSPEGNRTASISMMQEKAQDWINPVRSGHMHRRNVWFSLKVQFWPRVGYGLCSSMATLHELDNALHRQYFQILPLGGVVQTTTVENRTINARFYRVGLPHLGIEALHYGCSTATGKLMQTLYSLFFVELGLSFQPLQESYKCYGHLVTHSWMKTLWEKLSAFGVEVIIADTDQQLPREND
jgi:hypothetical protein